MSKVLGDRPLSASVRLCGKGCSRGVKTALVLLLTLSGSLNAQNLQARLQQRLDSLHRAGNFAGAQIGVALPDGSTIAVATGMADTAKKEAMTTRHLLLSGSVGKTYVSAVAMQLIHEGKFSLDDPISKYL